MSNKGRKFGTKVLPIRHDNYFYFPYDLMSAYHFTEISVKIFRQMVLVSFFGAQNRDGIQSCTIYKIPVNFSLSLDTRPGTGNPNKWYRKFQSSSSVRKFSVRIGKRYLEKYSFFAGKISSGTNRFIWILPGISGFSKQMVSAQCR